MSIAANYNDCVGKFQWAKEELGRLAGRLRDVADHLEKRPHDTTFVSKNEPSMQTYWPGCKSFDVEKFPDPYEMQAALENYRLRLDELWKAYGQFSEAARASLPRPPED